VNHRLDELRARCCAEEVPVLTKLEEHGTYQSPAELAEQLGMPAGRVEELLHLLYMRDLVIRIHGPPDQSDPDADPNGWKTYALSPDGRGYLKAIREVD
jgi:hypothetical protein